MCGNSIEKKLKLRNGKKRGKGGPKVGAKIKINLLVGAEVEEGAGVGIKVIKILKKNNYLLKIKY